MQCSSSVFLGRHQRQLQTVKQIKHRAAALSRNLTIIKAKSHTDDKREGREKKHIFEMD